MSYTLEQVKQLLKNNPALRCRDIDKLEPEPKGAILRPAVKGGYREDLGRYFRSSWEANIARYLNYIREPWEYESMEWEFPVKRGNRFYKCDFYLPQKDEYWEVKGYMDKDSQTKLNRMKRYNPEVKIIVIGKEEYGEIKRKAKGLVPEWE